MNEYHAQDTDENGNYPGQAEYELDQFINSLEGRLSGFTSEELLDEYYRRMFAPFNELLKQLSIKLDEMKVPF